MSIDPTIFDLGDKVTIDLAPELRATVTGIVIRAEGEREYEVSWFANGSLHHEWVRAWRMTSDGNS